MADQPEPFYPPQPMWCREPRRWCRWWPSRTNRLASALSSQPCDGDRCSCGKPHQRWARAYRSLRYVGAYPDLPELPSHKDHAPRSRGPCAECLVEYAQALAGHGCHTAETGLSRNCVECMDTKHREHNVYHFRLGCPRCEALSETRARGLQKYTHAIHARTKMFPDTCAVCAAMSPQEREEVERERERVEKALEEQSARERARVKLADDRYRVARA